jgi:hypothetical protein
MYSVFTVFRFVFLFGSAEPHGPVAWLVFADPGFVGVRAGGFGHFDGGVLWGCKAYGSKTKKRRKRDIR